MDRRRFLQAAGLLTAGAAGGIGAAALVEPALAHDPTARTVMPRGQTASYQPRVTFRTSPTAALVALTVDDGPSTQWTPRVLAGLRDRDVRATFFLVGSRVHAHPELAKAAADAGHELGNHTWDHEDVTRLDDRALESTLSRTHDEIAAVTGRSVTLFRPPYGRIDAVGLAVAARARYDVVLWSDHVTADFAQSDVDATLREATPGSIILTHDGGPTPRASLYDQLDRFVSAMLAKGFRFVTVSELLAAEH